VPSPYADRSVQQYRPALVVSKGGIGEDEKLPWVATTTSADNRPWTGDVEVGAAYQDVGLPAPSVIRPVKIATIEASSAEKLGHVTAPIMSKVTDEIRKHMGLWASRLPSPQFLRL